MNRALLCLATSVAASLAAVGCQNSSQSPSWNNPYAVFGPATIPAAGMQTAPQPGYYQPPPATPTLSATTASTLPPIVTLPDATTKPPTSGGTIRSEIRATPAATSPINSTPSTSTSTSSFSTQPSAAVEEPIRIVEAAPAAKSSATAKPTFSTTTPKPREPAVIAANPTSNRTASPITTIPAPAVKFNPTTTSPAGLAPATAPSTLPSTLNKTRGFLSPPQSGSTAPATKGNQTLSVPSIRRDTAVSPAAFTETASEASGEWKAR